MGFFGKKKVDIQRSERREPDGSVISTTSFEVPQQMRPVQSEVVDGLDAALHGLGGEVMHAMDPTRLVPFELGGPPVWSVGVVEVPGPTPYTLLVTYGFSHVLSPEPMREGMNHEYSLALPKGTPMNAWPDAFLRHQTRYVLTQGADIRPNDCIPLRGVPMTRVPFQPEHHAMMPDSTLIGVVCTADPVLPKVQTPAGEIEVRRLVGIDALELDRAETWSIKGFIEELRRVNPLLLSDLKRPSLMTNAAFRTAVDQRAARDGSDVDAAMFELGWSTDGRGVSLELPVGRAAERLRWALQGRVGFGRRLVAFQMRGPPVVFEPAASGVRPGARALEIGGGLDSPPVARLLAALTAGERTIALG